METPLADWQWIPAINVLGVVHSCRAEIPHMLASGGGLDHQRRERCEPSRRLGRVGAYNASKAAVVALSETLLQEFAAKGIDVAVAMPGFFRTRLMEHARAPADIRGDAVKLMDRSNLEAARSRARYSSGRLAGETHIVLPASYRWLWRFKRLAPRSFMRWLAGNAAAAGTRGG